MYEEHRGGADSRSALNYWCERSTSSPHGFPRRILKFNSNEESIAREIRREKCKIFRLDNDSARLYCCAVRPPRVVTAVEHCCQVPLSTRCRTIQRWCRFPREITMTQPVGSASRASFADLSTSSTSTNDGRSGGVRAREANIARTPIAGKTAAGIFRRTLCALAVSLLVLGTALPSLAGSAGVPAAAAATNTDCTAMAKARITVEPDE